MKSRRVAAMVNRGLTTSVILCADRFTADSFPARVIAAPVLGSKPHWKPAVIRFPFRETIPRYRLLTIHAHLRMGSNVAHVQCRRPCVLLIDTYATHRQHQNPCWCEDSCLSAVFVISLDRLSSSHSILLAIFQSAVKSLTVFSCDMW